MIIILVYIYLSKCCSASWVPFSQIQWRNEVLQWEGMKLFLITIVPIAALMFLDMACYEIFTILAGQFDQNQLSVHVALANTITIYYSMPFGLSIAVMTYVANAMGRGLPNMAKNYTYLGLILNVLVTGAFMIILLVLREQWATLFSSSQEIKDLLLEILNIYFIFTLFDGIQVILSGTLKGIGKQNAATIGLFISFYVIALPLIYCLAFRMEMGVKGIWYGFLSGIFVLFLTYLAVLGTSSFKKQAKRIRESLFAR
jgi:MATE family multidrug resistance protein